MILRYMAPELWNNEFLFSATKSVVICYSNHGKYIEVAWRRVLAVDRARSDWIQDLFLEIVSTGLADVYGVGYRRRV